MYLGGYHMIKVSKAYVLVIAGLLVSLLTVSASAAFGFSSPITTVVAGPGLAAAGPTTFNTYSHTANMANAVAQSDAAVNGFSPIPGYLPSIPWGLGCGYPCGYGLGWGPTGVANAANALSTANTGCDNTFATSFSTAGGLAAWPSLCSANFAGQYPPFSMNFF